MIKDLELKRNILDNQLDLIQRKCSYYCRKYHDDFSVNGSNVYKIYMDIWNKYLPDSDIERVASNLNNAYYKRKKRLADTIKSMLDNNNNCVFLTLTFDEKTLNNTSKETRRKYITRYLKSQYDDYVANIDYGTTTEREHYHAVIVGRVDMSKWVYGFTFAENIKKNSVSSVKLAKYVSKLTNHALKSSNTSQRIIYSRTLNGDRDPVAS